MSAVTWAYVGANPTLALLGMLSVVTLAIGLERLTSIFIARRRLAAGQARLLGELRSAGAAAARAALHGGTPHPGAASVGLLLEGEGGAGQSRRAGQALGRAHRLAHRRLWLLGTIGAMAPFIGLFGTVLGVMEAFAAIGESGAGGFDVVSRGLSEALVTTAAGIFVAIEAIALFNGLKVLVGDYTWELRDAFEQVRAVVHGADEARRVAG